MPNMNYLTHNNMSLRKNSVRFVNDVFVNDQNHLQTSQSMFLGFIVSNLEIKSDKIYIKDSKTQTFSLSLYIFCNFYLVYSLKSHLLSSVNS